MAWLPNFACSGESLNNLAGAQLALVDVGAVVVQSPVDERATRGRDSFRTLSKNNLMMIPSASWKLRRW